MSNLTDSGIDDMSEIIDQQVSDKNQADDNRQLARPEQVLPAQIAVLPWPGRPFFPGQVLPLALDAQHWTEVLEFAMKSSGGVIGVLKTEVDDPKSVTPTDLARVGTVCRIVQLQKNDQALHVVLAGMQRFEVGAWLTSEVPLKVTANYLKDSELDGPERKAYVTAVINTIKELLPLNPLYGEELKLFLQNFRMDDPSRLADFAASLTTADTDELLAVLENLDLSSRFEQVLRLLKKEVEVAKAQMEISAHVEGEMQSRQREVFLREQLKFIQKELGLEKDDKTAELEKFKLRIDTLALPDATKSRVDEELQKLSVLESGSPEYSVTRNYLDWLTSLPWGIRSEDQLNLGQAARILNRDHEGLADVKERILEFLGLGISRGEVAGSILLLVGPPGVGKTSLGRSVANALNRKFYRFSTGGMRDEAEIKGHRRTYIGAQPGKFIRAMKDTGTENPVIMLDEIDKIGVSYQGDPASALLEVLDPSQNDDFQDHYLDVPYDLSRVLFICTANQIDTIPAPLLDRMEVIELSGYLAEEKLAIASKHLLPRLIKDAGLNQKQIRIDKLALKKIIDGYAREAGVRRLEKVLAKIVRKAVMKIVRSKKIDSVRIQKADLESYLGQPVFGDDDRMSGPGIVNGLAWTAMGGASLFVEAGLTKSSSSGLKLTGSLGDVMRESAEIAYSYVSANAEHLGFSENFYSESAAHLHVPAGAIPKDGPSAGITMAVALVSLARVKKPRAGFAMTGELTLTGRVLAVGGIKEKILAAKRNGIKQVILPKATEGSWKELPASVRKGVKVHFVEDFMQVNKLLF